MSLLLHELRVSCDGCGWSDVLSANDLPDQMTIVCGGCSRPLGKWRDLKRAAVVAAPEGV